MSLVKLEIWPVDNLNPDRTKFIYRALANRLAGVKLRCWQKGVHLAHVWDGQHEGHPGDWFCHGDQPRWGGKGGEATQAD